ncbi:hypothetical protein C8F04DRAFT_1152272 [Mycena alexandri]|uniref:Uncharacterized protein n=1 Tax=Mycena alexandri TaxID=1745969 RepID=A0AAD6RZ31_9AGAR|nr:hypothetical protein C8F04DRAFT_1152272 [Mycena alexandri]
MTEEQRLLLLNSFRSVKFEWSDLDGMRSVRRQYNVRAVPLFVGLVLSLSLSSLVILVLVLLVLVLGLLGFGTLALWHPPRGFARTCALWRTRHCPLHLGLRFLVVRGAPPVCWT